MTATDTRAWTGRLVLAERYAALRHPALLPVTLTATTPAPVLATPPPPGVPATGLDPDRALRAVGEIALGLAALHDLGLCCGGIDPGAVRDAGDRFVLAAIAQPDPGGGAAADVTSLGRVLETLAPDPGEPRTAALLAQIATGAEAAEIGRVALAYAAGARPRPGTPGASPVPAANPRPDAAARDARQRRTRNRMLIVAAVVVAGGWLLLHQLDSQGVVTVPDVVGEPAATASTRLHDAGLLAHPVAVAPRQGVAAGTVIAEDPAAGTQVRPGRTVTLQVTRPGGSR